jgi:hypothetical protein
MAGPAHATPHFTETLTSSQTGVPNQRTLSSATRASFTALPACRVGGEETTGRKAGTGAPPLTLRDARASTLPPMQEGLSARLPATTSKPTEQARGRLLPCTRCGSDVLDSGVIAMTTKWQRLARGLRAAGCCQLGSAAVFAQDFGIALAEGTAGAGRSCCRWRREPSSGQDL